MNHKTAFNVYVIHKIIIKKNHNTECIRSTNILLKNRTVIFRLNKLTVTLQQNAIPLVNIPVLVHIFMVI